MPLRIVLCEKSLFNLLKFLRHFRALCKQESFVRLNLPMFLNAYKNARKFENSVAFCFQLELKIFISAKYS